jgi:hypothetical protein
MEQKALKNNILFHRSAWSHLAWHQNSETWNTKQYKARSQHLQTLILLPSGVKWKYLHSKHGERYGAGSRFNIVIIVSFISFARYIFQITPWFIPTASNVTFITCPSVGNNSNYQLPPFIFLFLPLVQCSSFSAEFSDVLTEFYIRTRKKSRLYELVLCGNILWGALISFKEL